MPNTVDIATFIARHADGATVIDVREPHEYFAGHVPGAKPAPMSQIAHHIETIPKGEDVFLICQSGNRSLSMASLLSRFGVKAHSVNGGTSAWIRAGRPVVTGPAAS